MSNLEKVVEQLEKAEVFYLSTVEGTQPRCRPVSFKMVHDGRIYFGVGTHKEVYRQIKSNPQVEICACTGETFLRYSGTAIFEDDPRFQELALEEMPVLRGLYNNETGLHLGVFCLNQPQAQILGMMGLQEELPL